jgi:hypothetical protein
MDIQNKWSNNSLAQLLKQSKIIITSSDGDTNMKNEKPKTNTAELSQTKIEQLNKQPILETSIAKSEDGKWLIHKTIITDIKPVSYFEKALQ